MHKFHKKNLPIPSSAQTVHKKIESVLKQLLALEASIPLHADFRSKYDEFLVLFHQFQDEVLEAYPKETTCKKGCFYCCCPWVEDVYSFEAEIIADYIKKQFPEKIESFIERCVEDEKHLMHLNEIMEQKLVENQSKEDVSDIDQTDLLLASFYQLKRPCPLLLEDNTCCIYEIRPLTCRIYMSFSDPQNCNPLYINESDVRTYLLDVEECASELLDTIHEKYKRFDKTGLRAALIDYLT